MINKLFPSSWYVVCFATQLSWYPTRFELFSKKIVGYKLDRGKIFLADEDYFDKSICSPIEYKVFPDSLRESLLHTLQRCKNKPLLVERLEQLYFTCKKKYPAIVEYEYIWIWSNFENPYFPLPRFPSLSNDQYYSFRYKFKDLTNTTIRRITENSFDYAHLISLHGLNTKDPIQAVLKDYSGKNAGEDLAGLNFSFGARVTWTKYAGMLGIITTLLGLNSNSFELDIDNWPTGQVVKYVSDNTVRYELLLSTSPINSRSTVQHIQVLFRKTSKLIIPDIYHSFLSAIQIKMASDQDIPLFNDIYDEIEPIYVNYDNLVINYRNYYDKVRRIN